MSQPFEHMTEVEDEMSSAPAASVDDALGTGKEDGSDDTAVGQRIEEVLAIAKKKGREDVLDSFRSIIFRSYVRDNYKAKTAEQLFDTLRTAVDCREEIHELERTMDKDHFVEIVTGGYFMAGGVEKESNLPIFWFQSGRVNNNSWQYKVGTPRANAFVRCVSFAALSEARAERGRSSERNVRAGTPGQYFFALYLTCSAISLFYDLSHLARAQIFMIESYVVQASALNPFRGGVMYADESARKALDFNMAVTKQYLGIVTKLAVGVTKKFVIAGNNRFFSILAGVAKTIAPNLDVLSTSRMRIIEHNRIKDFVTDPRDIPAFWLNNGEGKPYVPTDRRNVWCYERCLTGENRITLKDIFNPEPWPFEEFDYNACPSHDPAKNLTTVRSGTRGLRLSNVETFSEDEEDEW